MADHDEARAVRARYDERKRTVPASRYSMLEPANWLMLQERQRALIALLRNHFRTSDLTGLRLLEVGCGAGTNLLEMLLLGFRPANLSGIELLEDRAAEARERLPSATSILSGDATGADLPDGSFDVAYQAVVFSSILDDAFQQRLADRMWSWVRPGGGVLWYDFTWDNPRNPDVRGVPVRRIRELFPRGRMQVRRVTLAPPVARRAAAIHPALYGILNAVPLLRTHVLCWIEKP